MARGGTRGAAVGLLVAGLLAIVLPSIAAAAEPLPVGKADGVVVRWKKRSGMVFVFTKPAKRLYRQLAGREVEIGCERRNSSSTTSFQAPRGGRTLKTWDRDRRWDYCRISIVGKTVRRRGYTIHRPDRLIVSIPLTQPGAVYLDERARAWTLLSLLALSRLGQWEGDIPYGRHQSTAALVANLSKHRLPWGPVVGLDGPGETPPSGAVGYYGNGEHAAAVMLSSSGRRLFLEVGPDEALHTNVSKYIQDLDFGDDFE
jgi:hypothetical protein